MESNERSSPYGLKALVILGALTGIVACSNGGSKTTDSAGGSVPGPANDEVAALRAEVESLKAYRQQNAKFVKDLWSSYAHFYYCDVEVHKNPKLCPPPSAHIAPPLPPPPQ